MKTLLSTLLLGVLAIQPSTTSAEDPAVLPVDWSIRANLFFNPDGSFFRVFTVILTDDEGFTYVQSYAVDGAVLAVMDIRARLVDGNGQWERVGFTGTGAYDFRVRAEFYDADDSLIVRLRVAWDPVNRVLSIE